MSTATKIFSIIKLSVTVIGTKISSKFSAVWIVAEEKSVASYVFEQSLIPV